VGKEFSQLEWDAELEDDCRQLVRLAVREDLHRSYDLTTAILIDANQRGKAVVRARQAGVVCGLRAADVGVDTMEITADWDARVSDGQPVEAGDVVASFSGSARDMLTAERLLLNLMGRLSGVATLARRYADRVSATSARIYDTRKTTPGWRRLEKYAVRSGGGHNHRTGLFDAVLIKDNHLALVAANQDRSMTPDEAVELAQLRLQKIMGTDAGELMIEIEVDTLEQLDAVLPTRPDIILLDNMSIAQLTEAVARRSARAPAVQLEASGGVTLDTVAGIAATGVDRISVGALTHAARSLDLALDWC